MLEQGLGGSEDPLLAARCRHEGRILVTLDMDCADIRSYPPAEYSSLIVLRLRRHDRPHVLDSITRLMPVLRHESLEGRLWIVEENRIRIRGESEQA